MNKPHKINSMVYSCDVCNFITCYKLSLTRHLDSKRHQQKIVKSRDKNTSHDDTYECKYCGKTYGYRQSRYFHQKTCSKNTEMVLHAQDSSISLQEQPLTEPQEQPLTEPSSNSTNTTHNHIHSTHANVNNINNINTNSNNNYKTINNIVINNYTKPDRSHLTDKEILRIIQLCNNSLPALIEKTYFNKKKPENHSVCIRSLNTKYAYVHDGNRWNATLREHLVEQLIDLGNLFLENKLYDFEKDKKDEMSYQEALKTFTRYTNNIECDHVLENIKDKISLVLYNLRHLTAQTSKIAENGSNDK